MNLLLSIVLVLWSSWAWANLPAHMIDPGIRFAPDSEKVIRAEIKKIQHLLQIDHLVIVLPRVFLLRNSREVTRKSNSISGALEMGEVLGLYIPTTNKIYLSKEDYTPFILRHELCHCVLFQSGLHWRMSLTEEEACCDRIAAELERME